MAILTTLLIALLVLVCLLMVLIILMQRPKQEGLGAAFGGGMTDSMFGAQTTDVLQKGTTWLAVIFFCTTIALASIKAREFKAEADKGDDLISDEPAEVTPSLQPQMPDLTKPAFDPSIPLPGAADSPATTTPGGAEPAPAKIDGVELLPPPDAVDAKKPAPAAADKKPAAATPAITPKADAKSKTDAKPEPTETAKPAAAPAEKPAPTPAPKPTPAPAPSAESGQ